MEWRLDRTYESAKAIDTATNPMLRLFTLQKTTAASPQATVPVNSRTGVGLWQECKPETVPGFSAVAYYFGRDLQKAVGVPVGLIHTSWGGTPAQAWTSKEVLESNSDLKGILDNYAKYVENYPKLVEKHKADLEKWKAE